MLDYAGESSVIRRILKDGSEKRVSMEQGKVV